MEKKTLGLICIIVAGIGAFLYLVSLGATLDRNLIRTVQGRVSNVDYVPGNAVLPFSYPQTRVTFVSGDYVSFGGDQRQYFTPNRSYLITYDYNYGSLHDKRILSVEELPS